MRHTLLTLLLVLATLPALAIKSGERINLWPKKAPHSAVENDTAWVKVFLPKQRATGRAVLICPGGGYAHLAMEHEGTQWAAFYNDLGIAAIVLHYRMPHGDCRIPQEDAEQALQLIRDRATAWNINPRDIGIQGSSAGGHLATTIATHGKQETRPAFQVLFYPVITMDPAYTHRGSHDNFLGREAKKKQEQLYSNDEQVTRQTSRAWIALSDDDSGVMPANGLSYYTELYRHDVPASLHIYPSGGHGWGMRTNFRYHAEMLLELRAWLASF